MTIRAPSPAAQVDTAEMRRRADHLEKWYGETTVPAMLRAGADAIDELRRIAGSGEKETT